MPARKHCLHTIGNIVTVGTERGKEIKQCCDCNQAFIISFTYMNRQEPGHGPYHTIRKKVYDNYPNKYCPNPVER